MRHAIFTIVQDEPFFFPLWHKYYRKHYPTRNMYVLYHPLPGEENVQLEWLRAPCFTDTNVVRVFHDTSFDHSWLRDQAERFATFLLSSYDTVTFTEVDEIITFGPSRVKDRNLSLWLDEWCACDLLAARCFGYEVVHRFDTEPDLDPRTAAQEDGRVLQYRGWWYPSTIYSKTLIWCQPPRWANGFHQAYYPSWGPPVPLNLPRESELLLLHLHKVDYKIALARLRRTAGRTWNKADLQARAGIQNRFEEEAQLQEWWYKNIDNPAGANVDLVPMPAQMRDVV